jgi:hypothetical protein
MKTSLLLLFMLLITGQLQAGGAAMGGQDGTIFIAILVVLILMYTMPAFFSFLRHKVWDRFFHHNH